MNTLTPGARLGAFEVLEKLGEGGSRDGKEMFFIAGQTVMAVPVTLEPTFSSGTPRRLFDAAVQPWYVNNSDRSQVAPAADVFCCSLRRARRRPRRSTSS